ncbi:RNA-binding domain-containing protein [Hesseltinella vesiculosa]|uniref:RNA-binding domain-containing protein n=1 Tax=Hesseltinella vesiculosa TaxID=101127 RepID=A0A1X2GNZ9_9FUNG|nr:RNA-binding domain-containing protein [Hesseltinella vesiculosa]
MMGENPQRIPHDHAIVRACQAHYIPHVDDTSPRHTLFVGRLNYDTTKDDLVTLFETYGDLASVTLVRDNVTGLSKGYGFVTYKRSSAAQLAYRRAHKKVLHERPILVDYESGRTMKGWIPRRLGGGFGGRKESGQLRFGCRERPFVEPRITVSTFKTKTNLAPSISGLA